MNHRLTLLRRPWVRILLIWLIETLALVLLTAVLDGLQVEGVATAFWAVAAIGLLNALLWPLLSYLILPFAVLTLGLAALALNGAIILLASALVQGFDVANLATAVWLALGLTAVNTLLSSLLTIDDDNSWYRNVVRRRVQRRAWPERSDVPGFLFLEIDGLSYPLLRQAMEEGHAPTLNKWLHEGSHKLVEWESDLSAQTSAAQAGILHGNNDNIPAFRWYDRAQQRVISSSSPSALVQLEQAFSDGAGLLHDNGASRGNMFSGDAPRVSMTASKMKDLSRLHLTDFYAYFVDPYNLTRTLLLLVWDFILEKWQFWRARALGVYPILDRSKRGGKYPFLRIFTTVLMRELNVYTLIGDIYAGTSSAYATFVGYDEVAHHSGVTSSDALDILRKLDAQFARLESAARQAPRPYHLVVLSDHGQSGGATFKQRYGLDLPQLIRQYAREARVQGMMESHEDWGHVNALLTDAIQGDKRPSQALKLATKKQTVDGAVTLGPTAQAADVPDETEILVLASGNLGLVYATQLSERATLEQIEQRYPGLLAGLAQHEGIGWLMVHSAERGPVVVGANGRYYLRENLIEGENPLAGFGANARRHLLRYDAFPDAPDIYINSFYDAEKDEVAAFEELIGCHGGLGGAQSRPFLLYPASLQLTEPDLVGATAVYRQLKTWLRQTQG